jgi:hypothetical protein
MTDRPAKPLGARTLPRQSDENRPPVMPDPVPAERRLGLPGRQRELVLASLVARPAGTNHSHRRWD